MQSLDFFESNEPEMERKSWRETQKKATESGTDIKTEMGVLRLNGFENERDKGTWEKALKSFGV